MFLVSMPKARTSFSFVETAPFDFADVTVPCIVGGSVDTTPWDYQSAERLSELLDADVVMFRDAGHPAHRTHARDRVEKS